MYFLTSEVIVELCGLRVEVVDNTVLACHCVSYSTILIVRMFLALLEHCFDDFARLGEVLGHRVRGEPGHLETWDSTVIGAPQTSQGSELPGGNVCGQESVGRESMLSFLVGLKHLNTPYPEMMNMRM